MRVMGCLPSSRSCSSLGEAYQFDWSHNSLLDEVAKTKRRGGRIRIWSIPSSTGEEPYSIAMTMKDSCTPGTQFKIWASDIDTQVLQTAAAGIYKSASLSNLSPEQLKAHFLKGTGKNAGYCRVKPELKNHISFFQLNLMSENWPMKEMFDVVFCRNVMIYFDAATQRAVLAKIHRKTQPNGILFIGHSENFSDSSHLFTLKGKTMYMKA